MNVILHYPWWFVLLCLLAGLIYAFFFYRKERLLNDVPKWLIGSMAFLRFATISIITFLLLGPLTETITEEIEKPVVILIHDNSESILLNKDSAFYTGTYKDQIAKLEGQLSSKYEVNSFTFGEEMENGLNLQFNEKFTNISTVFDQIYDRYYNRNIGAIIFASDGLFNKGFNPRSAASNIKNTGLYTIALGDTIPRKDLIIGNVEHNSLAYLGNEFPINVLVKAQGLKGEASTVKILKGGKVLKAKSFEIDQEDYVEEFPFLIEARQVGLQRYQIKVDGAEGELTLTNNTKDVFIEVLDDKQKILLLANAPHPDIRPLRNLISSNQNYELDVELIDDFNANVDQYSLVILHQLPGKNNKADRIIRSINNNKIPRLFILGAQSDFLQFSKLSTGISITVMNRRLDVVNPAYQPGFNLFNLSDGAVRLMNEVPPVHVPFGGYRTSNGVASLLKQKLGNAETDKPLMLFNKKNGVKLGVIAGEGTWRWQFTEPDLYREIFTKTIQYLAVKEDKSRFRVFCEHNFLENEPVIFQAEVYNKTYELINEPRVSIIIRDEEGNEFVRDFQQTNKAYRLDAGKFTVGTYTYEASVNLDGDELKETGEFSVSPVQLELTKTQADHQLLYSLASENNGQMYYPDQLDKLYRDLVNREDIVDIAYPQKELSSILRWKWIFFVLMALLAAEWFMRKRNGAY